MSPDPSYRLIIHPEVIAVATALLRRATTVGARPRVEAALRAIEERLKDRPRGWGDPVKDYLGIRATVYRRVYDELVVRYTVHDGQPLVWWIGLEPVLGHPLREG
jgi:hypothetical protein